MKHYCETCEREKRPEPNVAFYNAEGRYFCEEHKATAWAICRRVSDQKSIRWTVGLGAQIS
jgi:hypothetical protein